MDQAKLAGMNLGRFSERSRWAAGVSLAVLLGACSGSVVEPPMGVAGTSSDAGASNVAGSSNVGGGGQVGVGGAVANGGAGVVKAFTIEDCKSAGGIPVASIGTRQDPARDCESGVSLGIIDAASSGWIEGGLCCAAGQDPLPPTGKSCGARAGNTCGPDEYCAYVAGDYCGAADAEATCKPRPKACIELYAPVCGCDFKTYDNSCVANAAGTGISKAGACEP